MNTEGLGSSTEIVLVHFQYAHNTVSLEIFQRHPAGYLSSIKHNRSHGSRRPGKVIGKNDAMRGKGTHALNGIFQFPHIVRS